MFHLQDATLWSKSLGSRKVYALSENYIKIKISNQFFEQLLLSYAVTGEGVISITSRSKKSTWKSIWILKCISDFNFSIDFDIYFLRTDFKRGGTEWIFHMDFHMHFSYEF